MDSSSPITPRDFFQEKYLVKVISAMLNVSPGKSQAAVLSYGDDVQILSQLDNQLTVAEFETLVDNAAIKGGSRDITKALEAAVQTARQGRYAYPKITVLIITGKYDAKNLDRFDQALKELGVKLYIIAISRNVDEKKLLTLVDRPDDIYTVDSLSSVQSVARPIATKIYRSTGKNMCKYVIQ